MTKPHLTSMLDFDWACQWHVLNFRVLSVEFLKQFHFVVKISILVFTKVSSTEVSGPGVG